MNTTTSENSTRKSRQKTTNIYYKYCEFLKSRKLKNTIANANNENIIIPFLHGMKIKHCKFSPYVFVLNTAENHKALEERDFTTYQECDLAEYDDILKLGNVVYNKQFNLIIILINEDKWNNLLDAINIATNSVKDFHNQVVVLHTAFNVINKIK